MNALMRIDIQVRNRTAAELARVEAALKRVENQTKNMSAATGRNVVGLNRANQGLERYGKNLQWTGRQIEYNFTLPILLAGGAATKFALDNERAGTRLQKVYGDNNAAMRETYQREIPALRRAFEGLSNEFGVNQKEVIDIGAAWAAAGSSGAALARQTRLTLQTMILGDMEAGAATEALIAIQAQYGLSTKQLQGALAALNIVENETSANFGDLVTVFQRAAGSARTAGVDVEHLAAMTAAMVPAAGSAAKAGNALRTIISRIMAPTKEASEIMREMGMNIRDADVAGMNGAQRLEYLASQFVKLTGAQQAQASALMASRHQITGFDVLMRDIASGTGNYAKALEITKNSMDANSAAQKTFNKEIGLFLSSSPQAFKILLTQLQNLLARIILPMLPAMLAVAQSFTSLVGRFQQLSPATQKFIIMGLAMLALFGPLVRYVGATIILFARLGGAVHFLVGIFAKAVGAMFFFMGATQRVIGTLASTAPFQWFITNAVGFIGFLGSFIVDAFMAVMMGAVAAARAVFPLLLHGWTTLNMAIVSLWTGLQAALAVIGSGLTAAWAGIAAVSAYVWQAATGIISAVWAGLVATVQVIGGAIVGAWTLAATGSATVWQAAAFAARTIWAGMVGVAAGFGLMISMALTAPQAIAAQLAGVVGFFSMGFTAIVGAAAAAGPAILAALTSPWTLLIAVIVGIIALFRKQLASFIKFAIDGFMVIPRAIADAFQAVFRVVAKIVGAIGRLLGAVMNPMGNNKPGQPPKTPIGLGPTQNLPEIDPRSATEAQAAAERARLSQQAFGNLNDTTGTGDEGKITAMTAAIKAAKVEAAALERQVDAQRRITDDWKDKLDAVTRALDAAKDRLSELKNTGITGMKAMSDAIFANEMAQKRLRLELLKMEQAGQKLDEYRNKLALLAGEIEGLQAESTDLRLAGAGSDITGPINAQITALEAQQAAIEAQAAPISKLQEELDSLALQAEIMNLEESLAFDPLIRQMNDLANGVREMPFNQLISEMTAAKSEVDILTATQSTLQASYDVERDKLELLQDAYGAATDKIRDMESALSDLKDAQPTDTQRMFRDFGQADFGDVGGLDRVAREGGFGDQSGDINALADQWAKDASTEFGNFDIFGGLKKQAGDVWKAIKDGAAELAAPAVEAWKNVFGGVDWGASFKGFTDALAPVGDAFKWIGNTLSDIWDEIGPGVIALLDTIAAFIKNFVKSVGDELKNWKPMWDDVVEAVGHVAAVLGPIIKVMIGLVIAVWKVLWPVLVNVLKPIFDMIIGVVKAAFQILRGIFTVVLALINGDWKKAWEGLVTILDGIWDAIYAVFKGAIGIVVGFVRGLIEGIINLWNWLYDVLVGHSIIPDLMNAILWWFKFLFSGVKAIWDMLWAALSWAWENVGKPILSGIGWFLSNIVGPAFGVLLDVVSATFTAIGTVIAWAWNSLIKPIWAAIKWYIDAVLMPTFSWAHDHINTVFKAIGVVVGWAWDHVIRPTFDAIGKGMRALADGMMWVKDNIIKPVWDGIRSVVENAWSAMTGFLERGINIWIGAFNLLARAINRVADALGFGFRIAEQGTISFGGGGGPTRPVTGAYARGGVPVMEMGKHSGFTTNVPTALVGEGNSRYPEWVIPTDPQHRKRALNLYQSLGTRILGAGDIVGAHLSDPFGVERGRAIFNFWRSMNEVRGVVDNMKGYMREVAVLTYNRAVDWGQANVPNLSKGGVIRPRPGGTLINVAERGRPEEAIIRPLGSDAGSVTENHFHGDLVFPNITKPDDAKKFIGNLRNLT